MARQKFKTVMQKKGGWTIAPVPFDVKKVFGTGGPVRIKGTMDGIAFGGSSMIPVGNGKHAITIKAVFRKLMRKEAGASIEIILEKDTSELEIPIELTEAFEASPEAKQLFDSLTYSYKRNYTYYISQSPRKETREKRAVETVLKLEKDFFEKGIVVKKKKAKT
jgi:hypothetical protein